jgi:hypothetical protein
MIEKHGSGSFERPALRTSLTLDPQAARRLISPSDAHREKVKASGCCLTAEFATTEKLILIEGFLEFEKEVLCTLVIPNVILEDLSHIGFSDSSKFELYEGFRFIDRLEKGRRDRLRQEENMSWISALGSPLHGSPKRFHERRGLAFMEKFLDVHCNSDFADLDLEGEEQLFDLELGADLLVRLENSVESVFGEGSV